MTPAPHLHSASERLWVFLGILWLLLAAGLLIFEYLRPPSIRITWETETETDTAGFFIYRTQTLADGRCPTQPGAYEQLNPIIIESAGSATRGAAYSYIDRQVTTGQVYCYQLEDVELNNTRTRHDPITGAHLPTRWWVLGASGFSGFMGLYLLWTGLKRMQPL